MSVHRCLAALLALLLVFSGSEAGAAPGPAVLDGGRESLALAPYLSMKNDPDGRADAAAMFSQADQGNFQPLPGGSTAFGFTQGATWFHGRLFNQNNAEQRWLLVLHYPLLDNVDLYLRYPDGRTEHMASGDTLPFSARSIRYRHPNFWVQLPQRTEVELLVRVASRSSLQVPLAIYTPKAFAELERDSQFGIGVFYGILVALLSYNLVLWLSLKDASHFWYMCHVTGFGLVMFCLNGLAFEYLWPNSPWWANQAIPLSMAISQIAMHQFCRVFLELEERQPRADRVSLGIIVFFVLMGLASFFVEYRTVVRPMTLAVFPGALYIVYLAINAIRTGYAPAKVFLAAWGFLLLGTALYASVSFGLLPKNFFTEYGIQIGSAMEMILLSFALAYRYAKLRGENERLVREHNEQLERHVARRTSELSTALEQLAEANQRLRESNRRDALTGLFNRKHFREVFEHQLHHASEHRQSLGVLLIDLDHFKDVNDTHGHLAGDECLRWLGRCLHDNLVEHGALLARFGGEEFVVVLPDMDGDRLMQIAEMTRLRVCGEPVRYAGNNIPLSASIGAYLLRPGAGITVDEALHRADDALYAAKNRGRNCVQAADGVTSAP
ncbi:sensor domain-containing diguanylate cyclase [Arenimonas terrae]|uniref:diguanylate cyclase n=1 Tax=Arenimonas terrae TaxID=2546226 RepID=A0A5C4RW16_9GAMM|nr:diguanylate cyclase [Arenimonas terrae]TNJ34877.1 GGDEF domain-containing protein [Arenimonas terrae]